MHLLNALPQRLDPGATPTFAGLIAPSLTSPASTPLTLGTGTSGAAITVLSASNFVGIGTATPAAKLQVLVPTGVGSTTALSLIRDGGYGETNFAQYYTSAANFGLNVNSGQFVINAVAGDVSMSSTTAGSSGAGALVVQGGISAGNTGSAASYFGGNVTVNGTTALINAANPRIKLKDTTSTQDEWQLDVESATQSLRVLNNTSGYGQVFSITRTGAATFLGAVTIGNTVNTVSPTSPNRTVTMMVNGVTLYLAAKTSND